MFRYLISSAFRTFRRSVTLTRDEFGTNEVSETASMGSVEAPGNSILKVS